MWLWTVYLWMALIQSLTLNNYMFERNRKQNHSRSLSSNTNWLDNILYTHGAQVVMAAWICTLGVIVVTLAHQGMIGEVGTDVVGGYFSMGKGSRHLCHYPTLICRELYTASQTSSTQSL